MNGSNESNGYASAAAVAGLARELDGLRRKIDKLAKVPSRVDELATMIAQLAGDVATHAGPSERLAAPSWLDLAHVERFARGELDALVGWMGQVYLRYTGAEQLPACWLWHPDVVEELLWLMYAWIAAYRDEKGTVAMAADWHDRYRPGVVRRMKDLARTCSPENHVQPRGHQYAVRTPPLASAAPRIAEWWGTRRDEQPPAPTSEELDSGSAPEYAWGNRR